MLSKPFRASMRDRPCPGDWIIGPGRPGHRRSVLALVGARTEHSSPKWLDGHHAALHAPALPACAVASADAVHRVACRGLLALASLSRRVAVFLYLFNWLLISRIEVIRLLDIGDCVYLG